MRILKHLFENNQQWAEAITAKEPQFFKHLSEQQTPQYLWIGCADSRVPANQIVGLLPGELFVHRNVANQVIHTDLNCLSVIQFAVDVLHVRHIIVCGHYQCGGVKAALQNERHGLVDNWLRHLQDVHKKYQTAFRKLDDPHRQCDLLCELNVIEQVMNVCHTTIVQDAWQRGQSLTVHGWIYGLHNGLLQDLNVCITHLSELNPMLEKAVSHVISSI
ncbi:MAG: carbonate dehydratase [Gemmatimonadetes bacterium]|nr:MAG: carbonate dehydratase [Gemmatimonadota bacterium]